MKLLLDFRPEGPPSGNYELRITVKPLKGGESLVRLPFTIH